MTVIAHDLYGNTATSYTGTVQFSDGTSGTTLPANYTFTTGDAGVHTFTSGVTLTVAGVHTLTVADATYSFYAGTATVTVNPAAFTGFCHHAQQCHGRQPLHHYRHGDRHLWQQGDRLFGHRAF